MKAYQEAYKSTPDQFAADGYDAIYILKAAVEKAGSTSGAAVAKVMQEIKVDGLTGTMTWTADGNTQKSEEAEGCDPAIAAQRVAYLTAAESSSNGPAGFAFNHSGHGAVDAEGNNQSNETESGNSERSAHDDLLLERHGFEIKSHSIE